MTQESRKRQIIRTSAIGIAVNVLLSAFKIAVGLLSHSIAIVLDAVNNLTDALSSVITLIGAKIAGKPPDRKHPYGHGRVEYLSAAVISAIILYAGVTAFSESIQNILHPMTPDYSRAALLIVAAAVLVKILLGRYVKAVGERVNSDSLVNSGQDALLDAVVSASTLAAAAVYLTFHIRLEAWLGLLISGVIIKSGVEMFQETVSKIVGERAESELSKTIKAIICETEGVTGAYDLILNSYGPDRWMGSVHMEVPDTWTAERIDTVSREIMGNVAAKTHVILTAIGVYSRNSTDDAVKEMRTRITQAVMAIEYVLQIHGFHCDNQEKQIRFDMVVDFMAPDAKEVWEEARRRVAALYPDYQTEIHLDTDISD